MLMNHGTLMRNWSVTAKREWGVQTMSGLSETSTYNHVHNTLSLFEGWGNLLFTTSKTKHDYTSNKLVYTSCLTSCQTTKT